MTTVVYLTNHRPVPLPDCEAAPERAPLPPAPMPGRATFTRPGLLVAICLGIAAVWAALILAFGWLAFGALIWLGIASLAFCAVAGGGRCDDFQGRP